MVRAKFKCTEVRRSTFQTSRLNEETGKYVAVPVEMQTIVMSPVYSSDPNSENKKFWDATPSGKIELGVINADAGNFFQLGREYFIDFTEAPAAA